MQNEGKEYGHKTVESLAKVIAFTTVKSVVRQVFIFMEISSKKY